MVAKGDERWNRGTGRGRRTTQGVPTHPLIHPRPYGFGRCEVLEESSLTMIGMKEHLQPFSSRKSTTETNDTSETNETNDTSETFATSATSATKIEHR